MHSSARFFAYDLQVSCNLWNRCVSLCTRKGAEVLPYLRGRISGCVSCTWSSCIFFTLKSKGFYLQTPSGKTAVKENRAYPVILYFSCYPQAVSLLYVRPFSPFRLFLPCIMRSAYLLNCLISHETFGSALSLYQLHIPADSPVNAKREVPLRWYSTQEK
jgi:hypothetical protein